MSSRNSIPSWLPPGKQGAVLLSIDDIHPATSADAYEAGGDLGAGALRFVEQLFDAHPELRATLFVTPDWRPLGLVARRSLSTRVPFLNRYAYWTTLHPQGAMRLDRHPALVNYLNALPRAEVAMHGLHHLHRGPDFAVEFQRQSTATCSSMLEQGLQIFDDAGLQHARGFQPPAWNLPPNLVTALAASSLRFVSSARDLETAIAPNALTNISGLKGVSLIYPQWLVDGRLLHITSNFQATSDPQRAIDIVEAGGLVAIKAHIFKHGGGHTMLDGLDESYCKFLSTLFDTLQQRFGDSLWWTSMGELADAVYAS